ncbi:MAG: ROK family transcriptional regulator [Pseudobutyrivibrio ruminis]|uniref:ROK family transcriptional regulator n=1 Tax=Pseudobutyrivibrio ruminis TaxID=46206 RepID=UPI0026E9EA5F|nr:ROK family transcriptional regulator [Pseudobutyrivibrio ruminis]MBE5914561.1 ROK family transcriptional regulator [Pseudobutyrivibrio ruminis]
MSMKYQGINLENVKINNRSSILRLLNNNGAMSRKDISEAVGLTAASVTLITTELLEEGVIVELGEAEEEKRAGRKKILVDINHDYKKVLCIAIEADETYISVTDLRGNVTCSYSMPTDKKTMPEVFLKQITSECKRILWENDILKDTILGVAVTVPGKVDRARGISLNTYNIWTDEVRIADIVKDELSFPIIVENNLKAYAQSEIYFGRGKEEGNLLLLKWGPGVGSAIIVDQHIYQGANGMAAEIGHMTSGEDRVCNCGRKGCLEAYISTHAIINDIKASDKTMPCLQEWIAKGNQMTPMNIKEWSGLGDLPLKEILDEKIHRLAHNVRNAISLIDPDRVVLIGYMFDIPGVYDSFIEAYKQFDDRITDDFFVKSELSEGINHTEGLAVVLEELFF